MDLEALDWLCLFKEGCDFMRVQTLNSKLYALNPKPQILHPSQVVDATDMPRYAKVTSRISVGCSHSDTPAIMIWASSCRWWMALLKLQGKQVRILVDKRRRDCWDFLRGESSGHP